MYIQIHLETSLTLSIPIHERRMHSLCMARLGFRGWVWYDNRKITFQTLILIKTCAGARSTCTCTYMCMHVYMIKMMGVLYMHRCKVYRVHAHVCVLEMCRSWWVFGNKGFYTECWPCMYGPCQPGLLGPGQSDVHVHIQCISSCAIVKGLL